mmetsp:Transcript_6262/g.15501  ORF Transcript_6262/g.15501 Transcript_6262/m.15501 type:complete len:355 (+) Transcript_6262:34-1098(+)
MSGKKKKRQGGVKVNSQCCFLLLAVLALIYVHLLGDINVADRNPSMTVPNSYAAVGTESGKKRAQTKPFLGDYIQGWNITKNVNWLLDFSIVGFPKTGTSTLMLYLQNHTQSIFIFDDERCEMGWNQHVPLLKDLYRKYQPNLLMGIKCPRDLEVDYALNNYRSFFPETRFIVGVRNPIRWFESFYNFRVHNDFPMLPPQKLVGKCRKLNQGVCTHRANFSHHLSKIEDTRKVFLYEVSQLQNGESMDVFLQDLQEFLGLKTPLDGPMMHVKPGRKPMSKKHEQELMLKKIDICEDQYSDLRNFILRQASASADWILGSFLLNPNVKVPSPENFKALLQNWHSDPCDNHENLKV